MDRVGVGCGGGGGGGVGGLTHTFHSISRRFSDRRENRTLSVVLPFCVHSLYL